MLRTRRPGPVGGPPALGPSWDRNPSRSDHPTWEGIRHSSFLDDLSADIRPPVVSIGIKRPPFRWRLAAKQLFQREPCRYAANDDFSLVRLDLDPVAFGDPRGIGHFAGKPHCQALSPSPDNRMRHDPPPWNIPKICHWSRSSKTSWQPGLNPSVGEIIFALHLDEPRDGPLEPKGAVPRDINLCGRHLGGGDEQGARLV